MAQKDTEQLENELKSAKDFEKFFDDNQDSFKNLTLAEYLEFLLAEKNLSKAEVIKKSFLNPVYAYHIFSGRKDNPSRRKTILLAFALGLSPKEAQRLLYYSGNEKLYVKNSWDSIILFALENKMSAVRANALLQKFSEEPLLDE